MTDEEMDVIFQALAHTHRRRMLDLVGAAPGMTVGVLAAHFDVSRVAVMNHLDVLARAQLIVSERVGTSRRLYLNVTPIQAIYERWGTTYGAYWASHLLRLKDAAERTHRKKSEDRND